MSDKAIAQDELDTIKDNFEFADTDGNGLIDFKEFSKLLLVLAPDTDINRLAEGFSMVDKNSDGHVDYQEFIEWWKSVWWEY